MIQVGTHQLVRSEKEYCEGVTILYILPGKRFNYTFILKNWVDEELLKWTIEHFEEK